MNTEDSGPFRRDYRGNFGLGDEDWGLSQAQLRRVAVLVIGVRVLAVIGGFLFAMVSANGRVSDGERWGVVLAALGAAFLFKPVVTRVIRARRGRR